MAITTVVIPTTAIVDNDTLQKVGGVLSIKTSGVDTNELAYSSVSGNRCQTGTITTREIGGKTYNLGSADYHTNNSAKTKNSNNGTWIKIKQFDLPADLPAGTTLRISYEGKHNQSNNLGYSRVYKNGAGVGATNTHAADQSYTAYSEDLSFDPSDTIEIWGMYSGASLTAVSIRNMKITGNTIISVDEYTVTNNDPA